MSHLSQVWLRSTDLVVQSGSGSYLTTIDGEEYLDFTAGIATVNTGYQHPKVTEALIKQVERLMHAQVNLVSHDMLEPLATRLSEVTPGSIDKFFFANSGAEITEAAVKLAKQATGRPNVVVFSGSYHGRTHMSMAMTTSKALYRAGHEPLPAGVMVAPFPDPLAPDQNMSILRALQGFDQLLATQSAPSETAAVVLEPVLGEGGYVPAPREFVEGIAQRCKEQDILFVADEVQTGFGRTGSWFSVDRFGIEPDILMMGKALGSGFPISALGVTAELDERWPTGSHSSTFSGNPMGCAAALATIDIMSEDGFFDNVNERGRQLKDGLSSLREMAPTIRQVRGPGLMIAVSFEDAGRVPRVLDHCTREGKLLLKSGGSDGSVIRWMPPLTVSSDEVNKAVDAFERALRATES